MACYHPIPAYLEGGQVKLWPPLGSANTNLPCGGCIGCKTDKATDWARRAEHEAKSWKHNCFLTLTYRDEELPPNGHLRPDDLQKFTKRLRAAHSRGHPAIATAHLGKLRYLACGEYGDRKGRPHYHMLGFNIDFNDTHEVAKDLRESALVSDLWPAGQHKIGNLTGASANYVAQYTLKKIGKTDCDADGVVRPAPFLRASLKPAIGNAWLQKYKHDLRMGYLVTEGQRGRIPRSYLQQLQRMDNQLLAEIKLNTKHKTETNLEAAEIIHAQQVKNHKRTL
ncbi:MAG: replication initiator protein [Microvirus sp.]|nr:MAG: replication initiator protein [Microvirus sp.]